MGYTLLVDSEPWLTSWSQPFRVFVNGAMSAPAGGGQPGDAQLVSAANSTGSDEFGDFAEATFAWRAGSARVTAMAPNQRPSGPSTAMMSPPTPSSAFARSACHRRVGPSDMRGAGKSAAASGASGVLATAVGAAVGGGGGVGSGGGSYTCFLPA